MTEHAEFLKNAEAKSTDESHRRTILKAITTYTTVVEGMKNDQFQDWQEARVVAQGVKDYVLQHLPELLETFEKTISARGSTVLWAANAEEARQHFRDIVEKHGAKKVVKTKTMTTEEIELNEFLEENGIEVRESDLGEFICQIGGEKPYHIVTPVMHKTKDDIARLFHEKFGTPIEMAAEELTMVARGVLRESYVTADIGVSGANFLIAEEGAVVMTENEGNGRLTMSCPPVHVAIAGIEKVLPRLSDLAFFLPLLATSGTGQKITCYNSIVRGPRSAAEIDGPEHMYVILLDNGRSELYARENFRQSLRCIRCGACLNACPVYRTVGGHTYNTTYQGPIGSVITPQLKGQKDWHHLSFASSLCGSCTDVCPVKIDLHHLLLENRWQALREGKTGGFWNQAMVFWAFVMESRGRLQLFRRFARFGVAFVKLFVSGKKGKAMPRLARRSFHDLWSQRKHGKS